MANTMEDLLKRAEDRQAFKEAQEVLKNSNVTVAANDNSSVRLAASNNQVQNPNVETALANASPDKQAKIQETIQSAKENIPGETMKNVADNAAPLNTPSRTPPTTYDLSNKQIDIQTQSNIESYGKGQDVNRESAFDKAMAKAEKAAQNKSGHQQKDLQQEQAKTR